mmetsp:Transcript_10697/g.25012  ORF Transcript_10697/g.25012 Transcript_10697/m.25012 type:complete len:86 (-) Transcript_10697:148-405(-)
MWQSSESGRSRSGAPFPARPPPFSRETPACNHAGERWSWRRKRPNIAVRRGGGGGEDDKEYGYEGAADESEFDYVSRIQDEMDEK